MRNTDIRSNLAKENIMEIGASSMAAREVALNKANVGQDILQKTLEKTEQLEQADTAKPVKEVAGDKQGRIDIYA